MIVTVTMYTPLLGHLWAWSSDACILNKLFGQILYTFSWNFPIEKKRQQIAWCQSEWEPLGHRLSETCLKLLTTGRPKALLYTVLPSPQLNTNHGSPHLQLHVLRPHCLTPPPAETLMHLQPRGHPPPPPFQTVPRPHPHTQPTLRKNAYSCDILLTPWLKHNSHTIKFTH